MLRGVLYLTFLFSALSGFSQIVLNNPSFENGFDNCFSGNIPLFWNECSGRVTNCSNSNAMSLPSPTVKHGLYTVTLGHFYGDEGYGSISQFIPCKFDTKLEYTFHFWCASYFNTSFPQYFIKSRLQIWIESDTCDYAQLIYSSKLLEPEWENVNVKFNPTANFDWIIINATDIADTSKDKAANVWIDDISPIYVVNAHELDATTLDTMYLEHKQESINLSATASATMDSVWWEQVGVGIISQQLNAGVVCVDSNTTFIIHGIGTDSTCAGYLPSSDTVRVRFYDPTSSQPEVVQKTMLRVYPNPAKDYFTIEAEQSGTFQLCNSLGQLVLTKEISKGSYATLDVSGFGSGVYYYNFLSDGKEDVRGKLVKE